jgi:hypothetical protein
VIVLTKNAPLSSQLVEIESKMVGNVLLGREVGGALPDDISQKNGISWSR